MVDFALSAFCHSGDINVIDELPEHIRKYISLTIDRIPSVDDITVAKRRLYYMLASSFRPTRLNLPSGDSLLKICRTLSAIVMTERQREMIFYSLLNRWRRYLRGRDVIIDSDLYYLYDFVDDAYFGGGLSRYTKSRDIKVDLIVHDKFGMGEDVIGYCQKADHCRYVLYLAVNIIQRMFATSHIAFGRRVYAVDDYLLHVFLHEMIHLIIRMFCDAHSFPEHSELFQRICKVLFGHQTYFHDLYNSSDLYGFSSIDEIRQKNWTHVAWYSPHYRRELYGDIINIGDDGFVRALRTEGLYSIDIGSVKLVPPEPQEKMAEMVRQRIATNQPVYYINIVTGERISIDPKDIITVNPWTIVIRTSTGAKIITYDTIVSE